MHSFLFEFGRIIQNEKEIQSNMKMCTGANVSLAQYFNRKLNTDDSCHWGQVNILSDIYRRSKAFTSFSILLREVY